MPSRKRASVSVVSSSVEVDPGPLLELVGFSLRRANQRVAGELSSQLAELELRPHQFTALSVVVDNAGIIQSALAAALGVERSNLVELVDDLESRGFLTRNPVQGDRRSYALHATTAGARFRTRALALVRKHEAHLLADLSEAERLQLLHLLHRLAVGSAG
jgi:DNA-binding MarR family transcriptional regulator